jgi:hypothetical protein
MTKRPAMRLRWIVVPMPKGGARCDLMFGSARLGSVVPRRIVVGIFDSYIATVLGETLLGEHLSEHAARRAVRRYVLEQMAREVRAGGRRK